MQQCDFTLVADNHHEAMARDKFHRQKSRYDHFELLRLQGCPGTLAIDVVSKTKGVEDIKKQFCSMMSVC
jgi:hypothetical protein